MLDNVVSLPIDEPKPSYYAIIPADVRYSKLLCDGAKLLYGEITCLCQQQGYSWASNSYMAKNFNKDANTISRWVQELIDAGFIRTAIDKKSGNKRRIYLSPNIEIPIYKNDDTPIHKNREHNNIKKNNKINVVNSLDLEKEFTERKTKFFKTINDFRTKNKNKYSPKAYENFFNYWTETNDLNESNKIMRFEKERFFEISKRLSNYWNRFISDVEKKEWFEEVERMQPKNDLFNGLEVKKM